MFSYGERLLRLFPEDMDVYESRAACYAALHDHTHADADRRKANALAPTEPSQMNARAWRLVIGPPSQRKPDEAMELASKAVDRKPGVQQYLTTLGVALYRNHLYRQAVATLHRSLQTGQRRYDAYDLFFLAMAHHALGQATQARQCYNRAVHVWNAQKGLATSAIDELTIVRREADAILKH